MNFIRQIILIVPVSSAVCLALLLGHDHFAAERVPIPVYGQEREQVQGQRRTAEYQQDRKQTRDRVPAAGTPAGLPETGSSPTDFLYAADFAVSATVHITARSKEGVNPFGPGRPEKESGSGALISEDGYIVTNNHVVGDAGEIRVTLCNKKSFPAKLVGADAGNDLAVLKIDAKGLPFLLFGNSDELRPGQWVLATGYPLDLEATVTAGIISTRKMMADPSLSVNDRLQVRHFIQTDAAINHGNSGGPLVNTAGQLIGIDSYFVSPTGAYTGYSFAIPVNIVKKIVYQLVR